MSRTPPSNIRSLNDRLRNLVRDQAVPEGRVRRLIGIVVIGQLLSRTAVAVVKGASNIEMRVGTRETRVSSDLDTVRTQTLEEFRDQLAEALRNGWEGFGGVLVDDGEIAAPVPDGYRPHRFRAKLAYRGGDFGTVTVEVSPEEVEGLQTVDAVAAKDADDWFGELGLSEPGPVPALSLEHQIAQKLHACTAPDGDGWINDRAHDLVDLQLATEQFEGSLADVREVAVRLFTSRRLHTWPPIVTPRQGWEQLYAEAAEALDVIEHVADAVARINQLIADIVSA